jgi:SNF2 family DNA or RNA helicase
LDKDLEELFKNPHIELYPKQKEIIFELLEKQYALLLGEQGVGKTICLIFLAKLWFKFGLVEKVLVVTKADVIQKFKAEALKYIPDLKEEEIVLFDKKTRTMFDKPNTKFVICDFNQFKMAYYKKHPEHNATSPEYKEKYFGRLKKPILQYKPSFGIDSKWGVVLDECQAVKNQGSAIHKIIYKNIKDSRATVCSSGTPVEKVEEVFAIFRVISDNILGMNYHQFMHKIASLMEGSYRIEYYKEDGVADVWNKVNKFIKRIKKSDVVEPVKLEVENVEVIMDRNYAVEYNYLTESLLREIRSGEWWNMKTVATLIHPIFRKIKEIDTNNPRFVAFDALVRQIVGREKVVVWDGSPDTLQELSELYKEQGIDNCVIHGDVDKEVRTELIQEFDTNPTKRILFVSYHTNPDAWEIPSRQDCRKMIYYSVPDSAIKYDQSLDRLHRVNSKEDVLVFRMFMKGTIDEWAHELVDYKVKLMKGLIDKKDYKMIEASSYERYFGLTAKKIV